MLGLSFEVQSSIAPSALLRADVSLFVGHVARRAEKLAPALLDFLHSEGRDISEDDGLLDVPVPIDTWDAFDHLFAWERRPLLSEEQARARGLDSDPQRDPTLGVETYLGAAVRSFFAQGGRRCWVVRVGDPWPYAAPLAGAQRDSAVDRLVPGYAGRPAHPRDRASYRGAGHVFGLQDVSFVSVPDLVELFRVAPPELSVVENPPVPSARFAECAEEPAPAPLLARLEFTAPALADEAGLGAWASAVSMLGRLVAQRRDVQLVLSAPWVAPGSRGERQWLSDLVELDRSSSLDEGGIASAFLQLGWPWLETVGSERLPGRLVPPEGALLGVIARQTLLAGAFRSVARAPLRDVLALRPALSQADRERPLAWGGRRAMPRHGLAGHVTLVAHTPRGFELENDVTTSLGETYRSGAVARLTSLLVRAARRVGEDVAFEHSGPELWGRLRERMHSLLLAFWHEGALAGSTPSEAFDVRCDETTMTQNDLDAGRVVCSVAFQAAAPIERITVVLAMSGGSVSISGAGATRAGSTGGGQS
jgi:uncharacterized protein